MTGEFPNLAIYNQVEDEEASMTLVDGQSFKNMLACWTAGITVVSAASVGDWQAITVNSFASVSMTPPLVCMNIANRLDIRRHIAREGHFAVSILSDQQLELGKRFAGFFDDLYENRFDGLACQTTEDGDPIIPDCMAWMACGVEHMLNVGENSMFIGRVNDGGWTTDKLPLLYHNRQWGVFQATESK